MSTAFKQVTNNAKTTVDANALNNTTSPINIGVASTSTFDAVTNGYYVTIYDKSRYPDPGDDPKMEIALVTAKNPSDVSNSFTLTRSNPKTHTGRPALELFLTDLNIEEIQAAINSIEAGNLGLPLISKTANYVMTKTDRNVLCDVSSAAISITLPDATLCTGIQYTIIKTDTSDNYITVLTQSGQTISAAANLFINEEGQALSVVSNGTNWVLL